MISVSLQVVTDWLADHGYRDQYPRRDAADPDALLHVFVKEGRRRLAVRSVTGEIRRVHFEKLKQVVLNDEQDSNIPGS